MPARSSITWAVMWRLDRKTARRGRSAVPRTFLRTRACRRMRALRLSLAVMLMTRPSPSCSRRSLAGLAGLASDVLVAVAHALALVGLGLAQLADVGGHLADELLVDALDRDVRRRGDLELDAVGGLDVDGVAVPERELEVLALRRGAVAD